MPSTVLITGASGAVAGAAVRVFSEAGYGLLLVAHSEAGAARLRERYPDAHVEVADLTDAAAARTAVERLARAGGRIDALLNIAGGFSMQAAAEATEADYERMFGLNVRTLFNTTRAVVPVMKAQGGGFILGVAAAAADTGAAGMALYAASKSAAAVYLASLDAELAADGIRVSTLYPMGAVDTPGNRSAMPDADPSDWVDPVELAESMLFLARRSPRGHVRAHRVHAPSTR